MTVFMNENLKVNTHLTTCDTIECTHNGECWQCHLSPNYGQMPVEYHKKVQD